jgi:hypothetical protein
MSTLVMTELLEQAIAQLKTIPASDQNAIAPLILEELEDTAQLASEAMAKDRTIHCGT